ncbi:MAG: tryptophan synthase subunit alpha, partial [Alphaproteobacteria bacterium]|nr:tryptophan synthase subunit alpha [Alphaproteobacteria bacterium]
MTQRLDKRFADLKTQGRAALVTFNMAYDPNLETCTAFLHALPDAGADIIELGIPFSDPVADGPIIQEAGLRALRAGASLQGVLNMVKDFRKNNADTPIILMGYYNPIFHYGCERFAANAVESGVDGVIIVDLPLEEIGELQYAADEHSLALIRLVAPTTGDERFKTMLNGARGFAYYIAVAGITGQNSANINDLRQRVEHFHSLANLPLAVGFGVKTP